MWANVVFKKTHQQCSYGWLPGSQRDQDNMVRQFHAPCQSHERRNRPFQNTFDPLMTKHPQNIQDIAGCRRESIGVHQLLWMLCSDQFAFVHRWQQLSIVLHFWRNVVRIARSHSSQLLRLNVWKQWILVTTCIATTIKISKGRVV